LGGIIEVESEPGVGSRFTLFLPQKYTGAETPATLQQLEAAPVDIPALPADADFTGRKVLVIDDDVRNVFALTSVLKIRGMNVIYAENGEQGIKVLKENPDTEVVLMDTMMPEMDGLEATREIRKIAEFENLPIISLTANAMKGDREKCLASGASDYVTKPVGEMDLLAVIYRWLKKDNLQNSKVEKIKPIKAQANDGIHVQ
jgi:CheY-like chemotaxis protein